MLKVPKSLRKELKKPLGDLHKSIDLIENPLQKHLSENKLLIGIGDVTTRKLVELGLIPQICVVDNLIERKPVQNELNHTSNIKYVNNPAGVITEELTDLLYDSIDTATKDNPVIIVVDGEEDLAVLPCIIKAPKDTLILYGQPKEGIVLVDVNQAYDKAQEYINKLIKE